MRRFVIVGQRANAAGDYLLDDLPGTSGRLDVLLRSVRAALLTSHGVRRDTSVYLVLGGGPRAPRALRIEGERAKFVRPDERSLATLVKKSLASDADERATGFVEVRPGISVAKGGLDPVLADLGGAAPYLLEETGADVRGLELSTDAALFLGDHVGLEPDVRDRILALGAPRIRVGPVSLHTDDVVTILSNELDRRHTK